MVCPDVEDVFLPLARGFLVDPMQSKYVQCIVTSSLGSPRDAENKSPGCWNCCHGYIRKRNMAKSRWARPSREHSPAWYVISFLSRFLDSRPSSLAAAVKFASSCLLFRTGVLEPSSHARIRYCTARIRKSRFTRHQYLSGGIQPRNWQRRVWESTRFCSLSGISMRRPLVSRL
jgi:hypothetical protein